jgi:hypothetical protein
MNADKLVFDPRQSKFIGGPVFFTASWEAAANSGKPTA